MQQLIWLIAIFLIAILTYVISYVRFRSMIIRQTKQMIKLMKAEEVDFPLINNAFDQTDADFADLERAALGLRKKYLRLRKQSQEESKGYETVFSGLKEAIVTVDQNLRIISFNSAFLNTFKWLPSKNQSVYFLHDVVRDPEVISTFKKTFEGNAVEKNEMNDLQLFVTPLPSRLENETWCLGVFYDLSEIRKTEKIKIDFVANASHELRTPLTVIKGYSQLLLKKVTSSENKDLLSLVQPIADSSDSMAELMDDLLSLSKLDLASSLVKEKISTAQVTEDVLREVQSLQQMKGKQIVVTDQAKEIFANYDALKQILRNLLVNAIKYSGENDLQARKIEISWEKNLKNTFLKVKDFGPGIAKEHQDRIFERFYRVDKGRGRDHGGSGLGLALVKHHVLNHQGQILLNPDFAKGTEFICEFPNAPERQA